MRPDGRTRAADELSPGARHAMTLSDQDGYLAALTNFRCIANALWSTDETLRQI